MFRPPHARTTGRLVGLLALLFSLLLSGPPGASIAAAQADRDPAEIAITTEEAGKEAYVMADEAGQDERSRWVHRRWGRDRDNEDVSVGPIFTDNYVWVARDVATAQAIFKEQAAKGKDFPQSDQSQDRHDGPLEFNIQPIGDDVAAWSACTRDRCEGRIDLHQLVLVRKGNIVTTMYIFGRERNTTQELVRWFVDRLLERM